jgi:hypothetical protein
VVVLDPIVPVPGGVMQRIWEQLIDNAQQRCEALGTRQKKPTMKSYDDSSRLARINEHPIHQRHSALTTYAK